MVVYLMEGRFYVCGAVDEILFLPYFFISMVMNCCFQDFFLMEFTESPIAFDNFDEL